MDFGTAIKTCFSKYATFSGRARRSEYWFFYLLTVIAGIPAGIADVLLAFGTGVSLPIVRLLVWVVLLLPSIAVTVRRLHDTNRSGWIFGGFFLFMGVLVTTFAVVFASAMSGGKPNFSAADAILIGVFGFGTFGYAVYLFVLIVLNGTAGPNKYGADPKGPDIAVFT